ncbi:MAG: DUF58 domain-containing protein [Nitrospiraceae bacterium]
MHCERVRQFVRWFYRYRSIRLTPEGTKLILFTLAVGLAAINTGNNLLYLLLAMLLSLIVVSGLLSEQCLKRLEIRRQLPEYLFANQPTTVALSIANRKLRIPSFSLRVMDVVQGAAVDRGLRLLHLPPRASVMLSYPLLVARRGFYRIQGIKVLTRFPFGLFIKAATLPLESEVVVCPELRPLPDALVHDLTTQQGQDQALSRRGLGFSLYNLRLYRPGDDSRAIHWMTTARQSKLIVRETQAEDQRRVTIALSTAIPSNHHQDFERAVTLAASLIAFFHERSYALRALVGDLEIPYGIGEAHFYSILRALALCEPIQVVESAPVSNLFKMLGDGSECLESVLLVLPWPDPHLTAACQGVSRVLLASELA